MRPSQVWICWKMLEQVRNTVLFSGSWMKPRQLWGCVSCVTWIDRPLVNQAAIMERQNIIQVFLDNFFERSDLDRESKRCLRY